VILFKIVVVFFLFFLICGLVLVIENKEYKTETKEISQKFPRTTIKPKEDIKPEEVYIIKNTTKEIINTKSKGGTVWNLE